MARKSCTRTGCGCLWALFTASPIFKVADELFLLRVDGDHRVPGGLECFHLGVDMLELSVAIWVVGTFAGLAVGLKAEVETFQQPANQLLTSDEAPLGQAPRRDGAGSGLTHRNAASGSPRIDGSTSSFKASKIPGWISIAGFCPPPAGEPARCTAPPPARRSARPRPMVLQANSGGPRNRGSIPAAPGSACFTGREQASVSFIEERSECIVAGPDGILVDHPARLHAKTPDSHRFFRIRSLRYCRILESFLPSRLFRLRPLASLRG